MPLPFYLHAQPRLIDRKPRWANQTDSGQNRLSPGQDRARDRSVTYPGIAEAMASQWGNPQPAPINWARIYPTPYPLGNPAAFGHGKPA